MITSDSIMASLTNFFTACFVLALSQAAASELELVLQRLEALELQVKEQNSLIANQQEHIHNQDKKIQDLQTMCKDQQTIISVLTGVHDSTFKHAEQSGPHRSDQLNQLDYNKSKRFILDSYETVAFHATVSGTVEHINVNQTIVFDMVKLNVGGSYHASGGIFIAPVGGIYVFSTSVTFNNNQDESHVIIEKNGVEIAGAYGNARNGLHEQGSVTVALQLKVGDEVYVSNQRHREVIVYGDNLSSFMGFLLYVI